MIHKLVFSISLIAALSANAATSSSHKYYEYMPVRDQDGVGICYAYAAEQLLDGYFMAKMDNPASYGKYCSPLEAAFFFNLASASSDGTSIRTPTATNKNRLFFEGGWSCKIIDYFNKNGCCDHQILSDKLGGLSPKDFIDELEKRVKAAKLSHEAAKRLVLNFPFSTANKDTMNNILSSIRSSAKPADDAAKYALKLCPAASDGTKNQLSSQMMQKAMDGKITDVLKDAINAACSQKARIHHPALKCAEVNLGIAGDAAHLEAKRQELKNYFELKPKRPLGVDYCADFLWKGYSFTADNAHCSRHASILVDRRINPKTKQVEYMLRNSWGPSTDLYADDVKKGAIPNTGTIWVPEEQLVKYLYQIEKVGE